MQGEVIDQLVARPASLPNGFCNVVLSDRVGSVFLCGLTLRTLRLCVKYLFQRTISRKDAKPQKHAKPKLRHYYRVVFTAAA